jgi:hypothetical protein
MYKSAEFISRDFGRYVSPYIVRHLSNIFSWKRTVKRTMPIAKGILAGKMPAEYYQHIIIEGLDNE